jgi:hypothetical protein
MKSKKENSVTPTGLSESQGGSSGKVKGGEAKQSEAKQHTRANETGGSPTWEPVDLDLDVINRITVHDFRLSIAYNGTSPDNQIERFIESQPGLRGYVPCWDSVSRHWELENGFLVTFAWYLCGALALHYGEIPVLETKQFLASEVEAKERLRDPAMAKWLEELELVQFANRWVSECYDFDLNDVICDWEYVLLKILALFLSFNDALKNRARTIPREGMTLDEVREFLRPAKTGKIQDPHPNERADEAPEYN